MEAQLKNVVSRLENLASRFEAVCPKGASSVSCGPASSDSDSPIVRSFDEILNGSVAQFLSISANIGGDVAHMGTLVSKAFKIQREFIVLTSKYAKPSDGDFGKLMNPTAEIITEVQTYRERNRPSKLFNHLSAVSESISALGWISVAPTPAPYIKEALDSGQFYTNRVLKDYKGKEQIHCDWVANWIQSLTALHAYVRQYHTTGVVWNPKGGPVPVVAAQTQGGAPPPPPPPPPPGDFNGSSGPSDDGRAELFASISQGGDITKGLRKVRPEEQTHKNPSIRAGATVPDKAPSAAPAPPTRAAVAHPPVLELIGKKWIVENHKDNPQLLISSSEMNQSVYIYNCTKCAIQVKGKLNSIVVDSCKKTSLLFENIVASVEFINCQSVQTQVTGVVPTVSVDKTDGIQLFLSAASMGTEIISAKSSEMNVSYPKPNGEFVEVPLPEQFKSIWNGKKFVTVATEST